MDDAQSPGNDADPISCFFPTVQYARHLSRFYHNEPNCVEFLFANDRCVIERHVMGQQFVSENLFAPYILLAMVPLVFIYLVTRVPLHATVLLLPVSMLLLAAFSLGVSLILSTFVAFFPDVAEMYPIVLTAWMYLTPIIVPEEIYTKILGGWLLRLNPFFPVIRVFRLVIFDGKYPTLAEWGIAAGIALGTLLIGWIFFTQKSKSFAYHV
jgi:ABC-type polysaccharide/polyol phosphate export permease